MAAVEFSEKLSFWVKEVKKGWNDPTLIILKQGKFHWVLPHPLFSLEPDRRRDKVEFHLKSDR